MDIPNCRTHARRPISIVRILEDQDEYSARTHPTHVITNNQSGNSNYGYTNPNTLGYRTPVMTHSQEDLSDISGDQVKQTIRIMPWQPTEPITYEPNHSDLSDENRPGTVSTTVRRPAEVGYVREISIPSGSTPEMYRKEPHPISSSPNTPYNSHSRVVMELPLNPDYNPPGSLLHGTVISRPSSVDAHNANSFHNNGNHYSQDSTFHRTIPMNGAHQDSFVSLSNSDLQDDTESTDSDIQPTSLQRFPRLAIDEHESPLAYRIREKPSPQSTPSLPRRATTSQTIQLRQPTTQESLNTSIDQITSGPGRYKPVQTTTDGGSDQGSMTLKHPVAPTILRLTEQLFRNVSQPSTVPMTIQGKTVASVITTTTLPITTPTSPNLQTKTSTAFTNITMSPPTRHDDNWFRRNEASNLMRDFGLPPNGYDTTYPENTFSRVPRWFHGTIDRSRAEQLLRQVDLDGAFLVRVDPSAQRYVISVLWAGICSHVLVSVITPEPGQNSFGPSYQLFGFPNVNQFSSLRELIQYYATHPLTPQEHQLLLYAVGQVITPSGLPDYADLFYPPTPMDRQTRF
ncbi:unnamed protein product [Echinostoma caproni]|uniref:SH2 domain-containing protein n=1 Tax=Echinostoma caproni TaxID=27848 RepID=A0A183A871_9TREM|nr:unnamed protein product [Echinostoma caproni]